VSSGPSSPRSRSSRTASSRSRISSRRIAPKFWPIPWHLQKVFDVFELSRHQEVYATIAMPPRHGKTTAIQLGLAWRTLYDPACLNFYATYGANLSMATSARSASWCARRGPDVGGGAERQRVGDRARRRAQGDLDGRRRHRSRLATAAWSSVTT
jgi:hypothetical protein